MTVVMNIKPNWQNVPLKAMEAGLAEMATAIDTRAKILAPRDTGALINSGRIQRLGTLAYKVSFGSSSVPYARRRHYENRKNPQTIGYLTKAGESVTRSDTSKYFRKYMP